MTNPPHRPTLLPLDADAVVWNTPPDELAEAVAHRPLVILMHGFGSHERDLLSLGDALRPAVLTASVRAPLPAAGGFAWFPLDSFEEATAPDLAMANAAVAGVLEWLESVHALARTCGPVGLLGFSQGGAMVTHLLRHHPEQFACGAVLSGFTISGLVSGDEALAQIRPPVYWGRGEADPLIDPAAVQRTSDFLSAHTASTERCFPGLGHGVSPQEAEEALTFLLQHLTPPGA